jgi:hypothetical protein
MITSTEESLNEMSDLKDALGLQSKSLMLSISEVNTNLI